MCLTLKEANPCIELTVDANLLVLGWKNAYDDNLGVSLRLYGKFYEMRDEG